MLWVGEVHAYDRDVAACSPAIEGLGAALLV